MKNTLSSTFFILRHNNAAESHIICIRQFLLGSESKTITNYDESIIKKNIPKIIRIFGMFF